MFKLRQSKYRHVYCDPPKNEVSGGSILAARYGEESKQNLFFLKSGSISNLHLLSFFLFPLCFGCYCTLVLTFGMTH